MADTKLFQVESELAVLSIILKNPDLIHTANGLRFFMFSSAPTVALFSEFEDMVSRKLTPDPTLVVASMESKNSLDKVGGKRFIEQLLSKEYSEASFHEFCNLVSSSYKAREYINVLSTINSKDLTSGNIDDYIYSSRKSLDNLIELGGRTDTMHIGDIAKESYDEIIARTKNPGIRGSTWGVAEIDKITGGKCGGDLWVIAGRPGAGKSAVAVNSIYHDGLNGVPSLLIEREMRKQELMERLITIDTGIPNTNIRLGVLNQEQIEKIYASLAKLKTLPIYLDTNYRASDTNYIESTVTKFHNKYGVKVVYLDYIQLLSEREENQTQEIGRMTRLFKLMSNGLNICTILLSQLNRNVESRDNKRPLLSDMKQSGAIEEDADFAVGLYRDEYYNSETKYKNLMEYIILKNRNGPTGTTTLHFDGPTNLISEAK